jgi:hypothetical protein
LPVTKLSKLKPRLSRPRSGGVSACGAGRGCVGALRQYQPQAGLAAAGLGDQALDARGEALAHQLEHEAVRRGEDQHVVAHARFRRERPDPGIELLRGKLLL